MISRVLSFARSAQAAALVALFAPSAASAMQIQRVMSHGGVEAWLVESHDVPLVALRFAFRGGSAQDPEDRQGLAYLTSGMMDEGAGDLDSNDFQERLEELAAKMSFDAARDVMAVNFQTLTDRKDASFDLLTTALTRPRLDPDAIERVRGQILAGLKFDQNDPDKVASEEWYKMAFPGHPYSRPIKGSPDSVAAITRDDVAGFIKHSFARDNLSIAVVGDIDAATLGKDLDRIFGALPEKAELAPVPDAEPPLGPRREIVRMDIPQSVAQFGHRGIARKDDDFMAAYMLNYIVGGGGFSSRLMEEVREKRGLAYSVYSYLYPFQHAAIFLGAVATENGAVSTSMDVISKELRRLAEDGPTKEELENAKSYLTGSYALRFDTSSKIANQLLWIQLEGLGIDYVHNRNAEVDAITLDDIKRVAKRLISADRLITVVVGNPTEPAEGKPVAAPAIAPEAPPLRPEDTAPTTAGDAPSNPTLR